MQGFSMKKNQYAVLSVIAVLIMGGAIIWWIWRGRKAAGEVSRGQVIYDEYCAVCHGVKGDGRGEGAYLLLPKPRNFRAGKFRLVSSQNLEPTREDLFRTITRGMPDTPMPSWGDLSESDRWDVVDYILELNREGWVEIAMRSGDTRKAAEKYAAEMVQPGDPIPIPPEPPVTREGLEQGRKYYKTACAQCHGANGEGKRDPTWRTAEGFSTWSRNFKRGVFKGGREGKQLYLRFSAGVPGTPMPSSKLPGEQVWQVVHYVQSLSDPAAQERAQIRAQEIEVRRLQRLPSDPDDGVWATVAEVRVPLMPLWWHDGHVDAVRVKAVHDGHRLAFLFEWNDSTQNVEGIRQRSFPDGAAVQLTANASPPLFAMGAPGKAVNIWHWKALWDEDRKNFQDVGTIFPRMAADGYYGSQKGWQSEPMQDTTFRPADAAHNLIASPHRTSVVENGNAVGLGTFASRAAEKQNVQGVSRWKDGVWRLELLRNIQASGAEDIPLRPGQRVSVAFAIWDGSAGDRNGQKSVSIWNTLTLK